MIAIYLTASVASFASYVLVQRGSVANQRAATFHSFVSGDNPVLSPLCGSLRCLTW
jgi:hypothetical protein